GKTTCKCTVFSAGQSKVLPGKSADVKLEWDVKTGDEEFEQSAELHTNDPRRETIHLSVLGHVLDTVKADRSDIHFHDLSVNETASDTVNIYAFRDAAFKIEKIDLGNATLAPYFGVTHVPLSAEEVAMRSGAKAGAKLTIDLKPGLPVGPFNQTVIVTTNQSSPVAINIQVTGDIVTDVLLAGTRINKNNWTVFLGTVSPQTGTKHTVYLRVKGPHRDDTQFHITAIEPATEFSATFGEPSNEITKIATTHPDVKELTLKVRYTVKE